LLLVLAQESAAKATSRGRSCRAWSQQSTHAVLHGYFCSFSRCISSSNKMWWGSPQTVRPQAHTRTTKPIRKR